MSKAQKIQRKCAVCGKGFSQREVVSGAAVRDIIAELILRDHPDWSPDAFFCSGLPLGCVSPQST